MHQRRTIYASRHDYYVILTSIFKDLRQMRGWYWDGLWRATRGWQGRRHDWRRILSHRWLRNYIINMHCSRLSIDCVWVEERRLLRRRARPRKRGRAHIPPMLHSKFYMHKPQASWSPDEISWWIQLRARKVNENMPTMANLDIYGTLFGFTQQIWGMTRE